jgi:hypothetical protein
MLQFRTIILLITYGLTMWRFRSVDLAPQRGACPRGLAISRGCGALRSALEAFLIILIRKKRN